jgi:hypothetical protein
MLGNSYVIRKKRFLASTDEGCTRARARAASPDAPTPMISTAAGPAAQLLLFHLMASSLYMLCNQIQRSYPFKEIDSRKEKCILVACTIMIFLLPSVCHILFKKEGKKPISFDVPSLLLLFHCCCC